jgi:hypothetical protein
MTPSAVALISTGGSDTTEAGTVTALVTEPFSTGITDSVISPVGWSASGGSSSAPLRASTTSAAAITVQTMIRAVGKTYWRTAPMGAPRGGA